MSFSHPILRAIALPLGVALVFVVLYGIWRILDLPPEETLVRHAKASFDRYGLVIVLICATVEGLLLIGWYFPGTLVFFLGLLLAGDDVVRVAQVGGLAATGLMLAYAVNFLVGKHGWFRLLLAFGLRDSLERAKERLGKYGLSAIFMTYWQPNLGSLISTAAGILHLSFAEFLLYSAAALAFWLTFWSALVFVLGQAALTLVGFRFIAIAIASWIVVRLWLAHSRRKAEG